LKSYVVQFDSEVVKEINHHVRLAKSIWREAEPDFSALRITAGNFAGYGAYSARCHKNGIIEIPVGNSFSLLEFSSDNTLIHSHANKNKLLGILLHEIGHHVVNTAKQKPWIGCKSIAASTHLCASWLWICATGWNYFHGLNATPNQIADSWSKDSKRWSESVSHFNPYTKPPKIIDLPNCQFCGEQFHPLRTKARFCSTRCRVAWNRQQAKENV
jgi:hypothetical protein